MMTKNYVEARGKIIKIEDESITLLVKRGPDESEMTFLLADALDPSISRRDIVEVSGHIGLAQIGINEKGRSMIDQYLIADSVKPSKTTLAGSADALVTTGASTLFPHSINCSIAPALKVSPATSIIFLPSLLNL